MYCRCSVLQCVLQCALQCALQCGLWHAVVVRIAQGTSGMTNMSKETARCMKRDLQETY